MKTKTVVVVADSHFCEDSRFTECIRLHQEIADWVAANKPDLLVHTGDLFERRTTARERIAAASWLQSCADDCPVVVVGGNHDPERELALMDCLRCNHPIETWDRPTAGTVVVGGVELALLPWPRKAALLAALGGDVSQEQAGQVAQEALRNVLRGMTGASKCPFLFAGHVMVRGSVTSHGQPLVGCDMELGLEDLALVQADAYALGHVHKGQSWDIDGVPCFYPGSPRRTAFGELEPKGFTVVRFEDGVDEWIPTTEFVELSATPMVLLESTWEDGQFATFDTYTQAIPKGAEVRFRYRVESDQRDAAKADAERIRGRLLEEGAVVVKLEPEVIASTRARAPEVAQAQTLRDQLQVFWASKCYDPGTRRESLLGKLSTLEGAQS